MTVLGRVWCSRGRLFPRRQVVVVMKRFRIHFTYIRFDKSRVRIRGAPFFCRSSERHHLVAGSWKGLIAS